MPTKTALTEELYLEVKKPLGEGGSGYLSVEFAMLRR
jgi:hypothetical protein